jgi:hypothetical protein
MAELMRLFASLHTILRRLENCLPMRACLPIVQFTDTLGETMALPYQLCRQWGTFYQLLLVVFANKQGEARVDMGKFLIMSIRVAGCYRSDRGLIASGKAIICQCRLYLMTLAR